MRTDPAANKVARDLWKQHLRLQSKGGANRTEEEDRAYWKEREQLQQDMRDNVTPYLLAAITADNLLKVSALASKYHHREPHSYLIDLSRAQDIIEENKSTR